MSRTEPNHERHGSDGNVQPDVCHVVGDDAENWTIASDKSKNCNQAVDNAEDPEKQDGGTLTRQAANDSDNPAEQLNALCAAFT